jgi:hypothetical protein
MKRFAVVAVVLLFYLACVPGALAVYCAKCGTYNEDGSKYCSNCGEPLVGDFMTTLTVTAKHTQLFVDGVAVGSASRNTQMRYVGDAGDHYNVVLSGSGFSVQCQVKKSDVTASFTPRRDDFIGEPKTARETSELLDRHKNNEEKLRELQRFGHPNYQTAIIKYLDAIRWSRDRVTTDARERSRRAYDDAERIRERQDRMLTLDPVVGRPPSVAP